MSSKTATSGSTTTSCADDLSRLSSWILDCDTILVGTGAGLSTAAGLTYSGKRFQDAFPDFIAKYHYSDMYTASFQKYESPEEHWAYWSRHIMLNRYLSKDNGTYAALLDLLDGKDYFVITTNVDHCFQRFGFDKKRLFYMQGDYGLWQCSGPCHQSTYDNEEVVREMYESQHDMRVPSYLVPHCPRCGRPMMMNLRVDDRFVQDDGWYEAAERYTQFADMAVRADNTLFLELGVGYNTPGIIKYPLWRMASTNRRSKFASVSIDSCDHPPSISSRAVSLDADIKQVLESL